MNGKLVLLFIMNSPACQLTMRFSQQFQLGLILMGSRLPPVENRVSGLLGEVQLDNTPLTCDSVRS